MDKAFRLTSGYGLGGCTDVEDIVKRALRLQCDYCDVRLQSRTGTSLEVKDGKLKSAVAGKEQGAGLRVLYKGAWGFYATNDLSDRTMQNALETAIALARAASGKEKTTLAEAPTVKDKVIWKPKKSPDDYDVSQKHKILREMDKAIHEVKSIKTVTTGYSDSTMRQRFINSEGTEIFEETTSTIAQANIVAREGANVISYRMRIGGTRGFEIFDEQDPVEKGKDSAKAAARILTADNSPSGRFPLVADHDLTGVFAHEALGHTSEADLVVAGESVLDGQIGKAIASPLVTIVDDSTYPGGFGSFPYDDEGVKGSRKVLVEKGILRNFIQNRETAKKLGMRPNGGARAESYAVRPLVRMSNTLILGGDMKFEELIEDIKYGIYAKGTSGGQVDPAKGSFQFMAQEAFLIEKGKITKPLKNVGLSGMTLDILKNIDALANDSRLGDPGFCGKGQMVPVGDGGPHTRVKEALVGGV